MKLKKAIAFLLTMTLLFTFASTYLALTATAQIDLGTITWLTHWTEPEEVWYWANVTEAYEEEMLGKGYKIDIDRHQVEFDILYETIMIRHAAGEEEDIIHMHAMWIPSLANWKTEIIAIPPPDVQADVDANWADVTAEGSTFKSYIWGYPSEFNSWALVFNHKLFNDTIAELTDPDKTFLTNVRDKLMDDQPLSYTELTNAAKLLTKWDTSVSPPVITQTGFCPFIEGMPEEQRYQFQSLLWSNGGEYLDLEAPETLFNDQSGYEVMQLYYDLGYEDIDPVADGVQSVYDPLNTPDYWWAAWADETLAMMILPTWMTYVRDAMYGYFDHLGIGPIPIGPSGTKSVSATYNWFNAVTQRAEDEGRADAAWNFLRWLNEPRSSGSVLLPGAPAIGPVPKGDGCSIMGDFLIYDSIVPSRESDLANGRLTVDDPPLNQGGLIVDDFWFADFMKFGSPPYGRSDKAFLKSEEAQYEIGLMFEKVTLDGLHNPPVATVDDAAAKINEILPMAGDVNLDGPVDLYDAILLIDDWWVTPADPDTWHRGRSDIYEDYFVDIADAIILIINFGRVGDP